MNKESDNTQDSAALRESTERLLAAKPMSEDGAPTASKRLMHELQVHQIELEMQNEQLRHTQAVLEETRDRYIHLYDFAPVGFLTVNREHLISEINLTAARMLGRNREMLTIRHFAQFIVPECLELWQRFCLHAHQHAGPQVCELTIRRGDNSTFDAQLDCLGVANDGENASLAIVLTDITDRKHAEQEQRIAAITFESQTGMVITDQNKVILRVNKAFSRLTGYSEEDLLGQTPHILSSGRHGAAFYQSMWLTLQETGYWQGEVWNRRKNGMIYAEWLTISAVRTPGGNITHYVGTFSDITQNKEAEAEIHRLAYYDPLTQLPNRRLLQDRLGQAVAAARRNQFHGALLFLDLDNFKALNDTRGHEAGDKLLVKLTKRLRAAIREGDTLSRLGGDEFVVLLQELNEDAEIAAALAKQVGEKLNEVAAQPYMINERVYHCTTSIGICIFQKEELLKRADLALYQAKAAGRNTLRFYDPAMQAILDARSELESDLHSALSENEFRLFFQLQVHRKQRIVGAEVLIRWQHPEHGLISPLEFIPLAEETGLIIPIGCWVLKTACAQLRSWQDHALTSKLQLAVNVSARQFYESDFVEFLKSVLEETAINPSLLKLELTESLVLDKVEITIGKMQALRDIGVRFSIDDFGTGYSSLAYLSQLPLDQLKIDQSFVRNITLKPTDAIIVQTIIGMANNLGIDVIAEGVETEQQRVLLEQHGCSVCQGYLFGKPVPLKEFEQLLKLT